MANVLRAPGGRISSGPAGGGRSVRRQRLAGFPGSPGRLGQEPAGLRTRVRPAGAGPGAARVRRWPQPEHADPRSPGSGVDGHTGRRAGTGHADGRAVGGHQSGPGHPVVRGGDRAGTHRPRHRPARRGCLPADRGRRRTDRPGQPARAAGRPAGCAGPRGTAAGDRRRGPGQQLSGRGADRGLRAGRGSRASGPGRPGPP